MAQTNVSLSPTEFEDLVRRIVREELARLVRSRGRIGDDPSHEGTVDEAGDETLVAEALEVLDAYGDDPHGWLDWEDVKDQLRRAEALGELPN